MNSRQTHSEKNSEMYAAWDAYRSAHSGTQDDVFHGSNFTNIFHGGIQIIIFKEREYYEFRYSNSTKPDQDHTFRKLTYDEGLRSIKIRKSDLLSDNQEFDEAFILKILERLIILVGIDFDDTLSNGNLWVKNEPIEESDFKAAGVARKVFQAMQKQPNLYPFIVSANTEDRIKEALDVWKIKEYFREIFHRETLGSFTDKNDKNNFKHEDSNKQTAFRVVYDKFMKNRAFDSEGYLDYQKFKTDPTAILDVLPGVLIDDDYEEKYGPLFSSIGLSFIKASINYSHNIHWKTFAKNYLQDQAIHKSIIEHNGYETSRGSEFGKSNEDELESKACANDKFEAEDSENSDYEDINSPITPNPYLTAHSEEWKAEELKNNLMSHIAKLEQHMDEPFFKRAKLDAGVVSSEKEKKQIAINVLKYLFACTEDENGFSTFDQDSFERADLADYRKKVISTFGNFKPVEIAEKIFDIMPTSEFTVEMIDNCFKLKGICGYSILHLFIETLDIASFEQLIQYGADINAVNDYKESILYLLLTHSSFKEKLSEIKEFLNVFRDILDFNQKNSHDETLLETCLTLPQPEGLELAAYIVGDIHQFQPNVDVEALLEKYFFSTDSKYFYYDELSKYAASSHFATEHDANEEPQNSPRLR